MGLILLGPHSINSLIYRSPKLHNFGQKYTWFAVRRCWDLDKKLTCTFELVNKISNLLKHKNNALRLYEGILVDHVDQSEWHFAFTLSPFSYLNSFPKLTSSGAGRRCPNCKWLNSLEIKLLLEIYMLKYFTAYVYLNIGIEIISIWMHLFNGIL